MRQLWLVLVLLPWMECKNVTCYEGETCILPCVCGFYGPEYRFKIGDGENLYIMYNTTGMVKDKLLEIANVDVTCAGRYTCQAKVLGKDGYTYECNTKEGYYAGNLTVIAMPTLPPPTQSPPLTVITLITKNGTNSTDSILDDKFAHYTAIGVSICLLCTILVFVILGLYFRTKIESWYANVQQVYYIAGENSM